MKTTEISETFGIIHHHIPLLLIHIFWTSFIWDGDSSSKSCGFLSTKSSSLWQVSCLSGPWLPGFPIVSVSVVCWTPRHVAGMLILAGKEYRLANCSYHNKEYLSTFYEMERKLIKMKYNIHIIVHLYKQIYFLSSCFSDKSCTLC